MGNMDSVKGKNRIGHGHTHRATALLSGLYNPPISAPLLAFFCNILLLPVSILQQCARRYGLAGALPELRHIWRTV